METKFTKGDWTIDYGHTIGHIKAVNINDLSSTPTVAIYNIFSRHGKESLTKKYEEQEKANARLISAAPDMFNILLELQESASYWSEYDVPLGIVERIKSALNKAVGSDSF